MRLRRWLSLLAALCLLAAAFSGGGALAEPRYYIEVDITNQIVTVYDNGDLSEAGIACQMICSTGRPQTSTPAGTFTMPEKWYAGERQEWYYFPQYNCYAKWASRIVGHILFHSVLFNGAKVGPTVESMSALGSRASHGCVRLRVDDSRWIALNCPPGTRCRVYYSGQVDEDLRKRLLDRSFYREYEPYDEFRGRETGFRELYEGCRGERVQLLEARLNALGYLGGEADVIFDSRTCRAVKRFQRACGLERTGRVTEALWNRAFAADAPTGTYVTLAEGMKGPAVAALQRALGDVRLYGGRASGRYTAAVAEAVRLFQACYGYEASGAADHALQEDVLSRARALRERFGGTDYRLITGIEETPMGRVTPKAGTALRAEARSGADALATLAQGTEVEIASKGPRWCAVRCPGLAGYVRTGALQFFTRTRTTLSYESTIDLTPTLTIPTPPPTPEPVLIKPTPEETEPTPGPSLEKPSQAAVEATPEEEAVGELDTVIGSPQAGLALCAVIIRDGAPLYARPEADEAAVIGRLDAGEAWEVAGMLEDWIAVRREGLEGYVAARDARLTDRAPDAGAGRLVMGTEPTPQPSAEIPAALEIETGE